MATYSTNLALTLLATGEGAGTWGNTTNTNLGTLLEQAISGYVTQAVATGTDTTITIPNGASGVARNMYIELTGTGGASTNLIVPANEKLYFIFNNSTGAVTVKVSGQTGVSVPAGDKVVLVSNGTDVVNAVSYLQGSSANISVLTAGSATITTLIVTSGTITTLGSTSANITTLNSTSANITTLTGSSATITNLLDGSGNVRAIPSAGTTKTSAYTLAITDVGEFVTVGASGGIVVPNDLFAVGDAVSIFNNTAGNIAISLTITTAYISGTDADKASVTLATRGVATVLFVNPSLCVLTGNIT